MHDCLSCPFQLLPTQMLDFKTSLSLIHILCVLYIKINPFHHFVVFLCCSAFPLRNCFSKLCHSWSSHESRQRRQRRHLLHRPSRPSLHPLRCRRWRGKVRMPVAQQTMNSRDKIRIKNPVVVVVVVAIIAMIVVVQRPRIPLVLRPRHSQRPQAPGLADDGLSWRRGPLKATAAGVPSFAINVLAGTVRAALELVPEGDCGEGGSEEEDRADDGKGPCCFYRVAG